LRRKDKKRKQSIVEEIDRKHQQEIFPVMVVKRKTLPEQGCICSVSKIDLSETVYQHIKADAPECQKQ
jgi:hypothetical protein